MFFPCCREYQFERRVEYRAAIADTDKPCTEIDVCAHRHRTYTGAIRCAKKMIRNLEQPKGRPLIDILTDDE